ncbi:glycosyltransferase family 2 protein [Microbacterium sp. LWH7-1.2]|uniref:glycosyltransferase family 2 protein n=1 Tax=Microbacterium sp. LWH7-1.2 TaxID=3135257 RepID=UPI00313A06B7
MKVSAVIPTIGRPELVRAVKSVLDQTVPVEPIVVLDRPDMVADVTHQLDGLRHKLVLTDGSQGGGAARNIGVAEADSEVIAFLDDDDEWTPTKTEMQLELWRERPSAVITSRALLVGSSERTVPERPFSQAGTMSSYLLDRSTITLRRHFIQSSTLLMSRSIAREVPWSESLARHQDWGLLIELDRRGTPILTHDDALVRVYQGSASSISRSKNWRASRAWLEDYAADASTRARGDFMCSIVLRSALAAGAWRDSLGILGSALTMRPHPAAVVVGLSELARVPSHRSRS